MRGCCVADLKPCGHPECELSSGFVVSASKGHRSGVHQQLEQGRGRVVLAEPGPRAIARQHGEGASVLEIPRSNSSVLLGTSGWQNLQFDSQVWTVLEHFAQVPKQAETGDVGAGANAPADRLDLFKQRVLAAGHVRSAVSRSAALVAPLMAPANRPRCPGGD